jgi:hypothetical protein
MILFYCHGHDLTEMKLKSTPRNAPRERLSSAFAKRARPIFATGLMWFAKR